MDYLHIALLQYDIQWESKSANLDKISEWMALLPQKVDLVVLPEMFSTGFTMKPESHAESREGQSLQRLTELSKEYQTAFCGSMIIKENAGYKNAMFLLEDGYATQWYDKKHLFSYGGESKAYQAGEQRPYFTLRSWTIFPFICYDLRFPVWLRNDVNADLYIGVANWPDTRVEAWRLLLRARAIENQSYLVGVNRVGREPSGLNYNGYSAAVNYTGDIIAELENEEWKVVTLSKQDLHKFREDLPFLIDRDEFMLK